MKDYKVPYNTSAKLELITFVIIIFYLILAMVAFAIFCKFLINDQVLLTFYSYTDKCNTVQKPGTQHLLHYVSH
jgi:hypothetical protein